MITTAPRTTLNEGNEAYERYVKPHIGAQDRGKIVELDIESGDFEIGAFYEEDIIHDRLFARRPNGRFLLMRADGESVGAFGFGESQSK